MITFALVLRAIHRADRLRTAVTITTAATLLQLYVEQLGRQKRRAATTLN